MIPILVIDFDQERRNFFRSVTGGEFKLFLAKSEKQGLGGFDKLKPPIVILHTESKGEKLAEAILQLSADNGTQVILLGNDTPSQNKNIHHLPWPIEAKKLKSCMTNIQQQKSPQETTPETVQEEIPKELPAEVMDYFSGMSEEEVQRIGIERLFLIYKKISGFDELDYYQILGLPSDAHTAQIKKAYFSNARKYHPDHFAMISNAVFKNAVGQLFRRMTEAYQILNDANKRMEYDQNLENSGRTADTLRWSKTKRESHGPQTREREIDNPQARRFYKLAQSAINASDYVSAKMNLQLALQMSKDHPLLKKSLEEVEDLLKK